MIGAARVRCTADHEALKRSPVWSSLRLRGYQVTEDDDGNPAHLELRDCACGSTLAIFKKGPKP